MQHHHKAKLNRTGKIYVSFESMQGCNLKIFQDLEYPKAVETVGHHNKNRDQYVMQKNNNLIRNLKKCNLKSIFS